MGIALCVLGVALLCSMDAVAKALGVHLNTFQIVFIRFLGAAVWLAAWTVATRGAWPLRSKLFLHAQRGALVVATAGMFFFAVSNLPLAVVTALAMTAPLYSTLLGAFVFKEHLGRSIWLALALGGAGSAIIVFSGGGIAFTEGMGTPLAWVAAVLAPFTYATMLVLLKKHSANEEPAAIALGQSALAALFALPMVIAPWPEPTLPSLSLGVLIGLLGAVGFLALTHGLRKIPVSVFAVIDYTGLLWAALFGILFFQELPGISLVAGGILIISACIVNARASRA